MCNAFSTVSSQELYLCPVVVYPLSDTDILSHHQVTGIRLATSHLDVHRVHGACQADSKCYGDYMGHVVGSLPRDQRLRPSRSIRVRDSEAQ
jgi:hypothetical protein